MGKNFFFKFVRLFCKNGGVCVVKNVIYMQPNSQYIENNYANSDKDLKPHSDE